MAISDEARPKPDGEPRREDYWETPNLYGEPEALNSMGTIAAPLLAGFSLAAMVQTLTITTSESRWPDVAFLLFMLAAVLFVTTVQAMFWARGYQASPPEIKDWWPDAAEAQRLRLLIREQKHHAAGFSMWSNRARLAYSVALLCLLAALTTLAVPPHSHGHAPLSRWLAVAAGSAAFIAEILWITGSFTNPKWMARLLQPPMDAADNSSTTAGAEPRP
jgi:hypothetical protein